MAAKKREKKERAAAEKKKKKDATQGCLGCLGLVILFAIGVQYCPSEPDVRLTPKRDNDRRLPSAGITQPDDSASHAPPVSAKSSAEGVNCENWGELFFFSKADIEDVNRCLQAGADPNVRGERSSTPLSRAVIEGNAETVVALLNAGADVNALSAGSTPLHYAALFQKAEAVTKLIEAGADPNARSSGGDTPLHRAAGSGTVEILTALLKAGADVNVRGSDGLTPLMYAVAAPKRAKVMRILLEVGADPNARGAAGWSPLHNASYAEAVEALLEAGAFLEVRDGQGATPLHWAAIENAETVKALVNRGADLNARDDEGRTPLHRAAFRKDAKIVKALVNRGADLNARDNKGQTPLHWAALGQKKDEVVGALLMAGADPYARDHDGALAFDSSGLIRRFRERGVYRAHRPATSQAQSTNRISDYGAVSDPKEAEGTELGEWDGVYRVGSGVTPPTVLRRYKPAYSEEAKKARIEGVVILSAIVRKDGTIEVLKVVRSLDRGLDENAVRAIRRWKFRPGMKDGIPVDVALNVEVNFSLKSTF